MPNEQKEVVTDRSRILCGNRCMRERFLKYYCQHYGIVLSTLNIPTSVGSSVHEGRALILEGVDPENAAITARHKWEQLVLEKTLALENWEDQLLVYEEQATLIEMAVWAWYAVSYENIVKEYTVASIPSKDLVNMDILLIEPEINWPLTPYITFMSRPDSILRSKLSGMPIVDSFKTASTYGEWQENKNKYDDQGISEMVAVEYELKEEVEAIRMEFFIKGRRYTQKDKATGDKRKVQYSFLVHPYRKESAYSVEYALQYNWTDEDGNARRLGKGWEKVDIWKEKSPQEWVAYLKEHHEKELEGLLVTPVPYNRSDEDIRNWKEQNAFRETKVQEYLTDLRVLEPNLVGPRESGNPEYKMKLNWYFPQNRESCYQFGRFCEYAPICWEGEKSTSQLYQIRVGHHEKEVTLMEGD